MKSTMQFSIVIPLFNKASDITRAVHSVLKQTDTAFELLVVDDGSTDDGAARVEAINDPRIRLLRQKNCGVSSARNAGVAASRYDWVAFLDADDQWAPNHLSVLRVALERYPAAVAVGTAYRRVDTVGNVRNLRLPAVTPDGDVLLIDDYFDWSVRYDHPLCCSSVAVRKTALLNVGGFPVGIKAGEDLLTWARLACLGPVALACESTAIFYVPDQRAAKRAENIRRPSVPDRVADGINALFVEYGQRLRVGAYLAHWYRIRAVSFFELNERRACVGEIRNAQACDGWRRKDLAMLAGLLAPASIRARVLEWVRRRKAQPLAQHANKPGLN